MSIICTQCQSAAPPHHPTSYVEGSPALHVAVATGSRPHFAEFAEQATALLLENSADAAALDDYGRSALHLAADHGLLKVRRCRLTLS